MQTAILAGGCFWCIEAVYNDIKGVKSAVSGYIGGTTNNPTYRQVCDEDTYHAEAVKISFDPTVVEYEILLDIFFAIHDPTQLNRQGNDIGSQYRSAIFHLDEQQKRIAERKIAELQPHFELPIVTEVVKAPQFYTAEDYHQGYLKQNPQNTYCQMVATPKYLKAKIKFAELWKKHHSD